MLYKFKGFIFFFYSLYRPPAGASPSYPALIIKPNTFNHYAGTPLDSLATFGTGGVVASSCNSH
jgi:hypothetical protein